MRQDVDIGMTQRMWRAICRRGQSYARSRAASTRLAVLLTAGVLAGCSDTTTYRIQGAGGDFCVPDAVDITPPSPGQGDVVHGGFALSGRCREGGEGCSGADGLISLAVMDLREFRGWRFVDFPADAYIPDVAVSRIDQAQRLDAAMLAIPDPGEKDAWFIWRQVGVPHPAVGGEDELMARCSFAPMHQSYFCDRRLRGPGYMVEYSFKAGKRLPTSFASHDQQVLDEIERLRCDQAPHKEASGAIIG
ncbi:hypothetical protein [Stenotrophomonas sp. 24(2023)]|uniref:hypothetical protein n=1 Tax=Stenotrophomonas sp. 24(2023) TaxID=3068324 RepID=UPI0027E1CA64|nr:hypothetical protein [Stenotrophomonas sp. 24(2023)]WMJ69210.1 hypothetical protein Q9R17_18870 [Stenotrophomonas sp. 24(2023)]